jgi:hypothetical protein
MGDKSRSIKAVDRAFGGVIGAKNLARLFCCLVCAYAAFVLRQCEHDFARTYCGNANAT